MQVGGSPEPLPLISKKKKQYLKKCIIHQNSKDKKEDTILTGNKAVRNIITEASKSLKDNLLYWLRDADITKILTCYPNYQKKEIRLELKRNNDTSSSKLLFANTGSPKS